VKRTVLDAYDHQTYTYGTLVRNLKLRRDPSRLPLVEVQFNLERVGANLNFPGLQVEVDPNPKAAVNFDLFVNVVESDQGLLIDCDYNSALFDFETIARWLSHFETLLRALAADAQEEVDRLPILSEHERRHIVEDWNSTDRDYPAPMCARNIRGTSCPHAGCARRLFGRPQPHLRAIGQTCHQLARHLIKIGVTPASGRHCGRSLCRLARRFARNLEGWRGLSAHRCGVSTRPHRLHHGGNVASYSANQCKVASQSSNL